VRLKGHVAVATDANADAQLGREPPAPENGVSGKRLDQTGRERTSRSDCGDCPADRVARVRSQTPCGWRSRIAIKNSSKSRKPEETKARPDERHQRSRLQHEPAVRAVKRGEPAVQRNQCVFSDVAQAQRQSPRPLREVPAQTILACSCRRYWITSEERLVNIADRRATHLSESFPEQCGSWAA
jgi:hypothetical protein